MDKPVVVLDPGHGGYDPGAVGFGLKEKDLNLILAREVAERLSGLEVLLTRDRDVFVSLAGRVDLSRRAGASLFLSLHVNAGGGRGFESFVKSGAGDSLFNLQRVLHERIMEALRPWKITDRGLKQAAFYVLRHNPRSAVLIESLFIDNDREANLWRDKKFIEDLARGVAGGILAALGRPTGETGSVEPSPPFLRSAPGTRLYTVQVGAFAYIDNARRRLEEARAAGFDDAYIYEKQF